jgi:amino acid transporter
MDSNQQTLKKTLGRWDSVAINIAIVVGVGIFRVPSEVSLYLKSPDVILLAWLCGGIISLLGALCYGELSSSFPQTGGNYIYLRESYGPCLAFLFGWTELLVIRTGSIAAVSFVFAEYFQSFLSIGALWIKPAAVSIVLILSLINIFGMYYGKKLQDFFVITKVLAISGIIIFGLLSQKGNPDNFSPVPFSGDGSILALFCLALIPILWTYGGWHESTFVAGETKDAKKVIPSVLVVGIVIITLIYLAINCLYLYMVPAQQMAHTKLIAADVLKILYGTYGRKILEALVIISSLGCLNAMIITGSRVTYALAKDNRVFNYIGAVDSQFHTPLRALIINGLWSVLLIILGSFNKLLFFTGVLTWLFFALVVGGLFIIRRKHPAMERPYEAWGYPLVPALFILISLALFATTIFFYPLPSLFGLCLAMTGIPIFLISRKIGG